MPGLSSQLVARSAAMAVFVSMATCEPETYVLGMSNHTVQVDAATALGPFGPPVLVTALGDGTIDGSVVPDGGTAPDVNNPTFTGDLLELYFTTGRPGGLGSQDVWVSKRSTPNDPWGAPAPVPELNSASLETSSAVSTDGLTIYFGSDRTGGKGKIDVWAATRLDRNSAWSPPVNVPELNSSDDDMAHPAMGSNLLVLVSTRSLAPPEWRLLWATRPDPASPFGTLTPIAELNGSSSDTDPYLSADGQVFYFNSNRVPANDEDLYQATRDPTTGRFSEPKPVTELDTTYRDRDPWLSTDLRYIMFSSNRSGAYLTYEARR
jgi:hypothetical protein